MILRFENRIESSGWLTENPCVGYKFMCFPYAIMRPRAYSNSLKLIQTHLLLNNILIYLYFFAKSGLRHHSFIIKVIPVYYRDFFFWYSILGLIFAPLGLDNSHHSGLATHDFILASSQSFQISSSFGLHISVYAEFVYAITSKRKRIVCNISKMLFPG
jgi:hypothetical protein